MDLIDQFCFFFKTLNKCNEVHMIKSIILTILAILFPVAAFAMHTDHAETAQPTKHYEQSLFRTSDHGLFSVEVVAKDKNLNVGVNSFDIIVHDKDNKDVAGADIKVAPWMPDMGHGVFEKPVVKERGGGIYTVENVILIMEGRWELKMHIRKNGMEDDVTFDFPDVKRSATMSHDMHGMMHSTAPADLDTSTTRVSAKKLFRVSYASDVDPLPIARFISWKLKVETADGKPVRDGEVTINGGMPEHGHGLPTIPEVVPGTAPGEYIVRGLKFSMPGWWVITFKIKANGAEDLTTFNVIVP
jgi:hypothetical protein